jgi:hypothetical protein
MAIALWKMAAKQRARVVGRLQELERRIESDQAEMAALRSQLDAHDAVLRAQAIDIEPDDFYRPVSPNGPLLVKHGELTSRALKALRDPAPPASTNPIVRMTHQLKTKTGRALYGLRKNTVEPASTLTKIDPFVLTKMNPQSAQCLFTMI